MNMADELEYVNFYDFSKAYENHPLMQKSDDEDQDEEMKDESSGLKMNDQSKSQEWEKVEQNSAAWEECDLDSLDQNEIELQVGDDVPSFQKSNSDFVIMN